MINRPDEKKSQLFPDRNVDLLPFNTMGISVPAGEFFVLDHVDQLPRLFEEGFLGSENLVLGEGSNILFVGLVKQLVLLNKIRFIQIVEQSEKHVLIRVGAGNRWHELVQHAVEKGWGGIENLALIPGTVGAAPIQNIGAYGVELKDRFHSLEAFDLEKGEFRTFSAKECGFAYRESVFKRPEMRRYLVVSVVMQLTLPGHHHIEYSYRSLSDWLEKRRVENPTPDEVCKAVMEIRRSKLPDPSTVGNAGSFFKNPVIGRVQLEQLRTKFGDVPHYLVDDMSVKIPAGWLIEKAGWKGYRRGAVGVYPKQALVIVNYGGATGKQVYQLSEDIREDVLSIFGIDLDREVTIVGSLHD